MDTIASAVSETGSICGHVARFVDVNGVRTRYYEVRTGEPMVLCHGAGWSGTSSANTWTLNLAGLSSRFDVYAADKLGSGRTDNPASDDDYTIQAQVAHMYGFIRAMGIEQCHMVGQSRGGYLATRLTLEHPEMVKTLVVVDSATLAPEVGDIDARRGKLFAEAPEETPDEFRFHQGQLSYSKEHLTDEYVAAAAYIASLPKAQETKRRWENGGEALFNKTLKAQKQESLRWLEEGRLQVPTLIYWGKNDPSALLAQGLALFDLISATNRRARMLIVNQAGHFHYREYPEEWNRNVINFVTGW